MFEWIAERLPHVDSHRGIWGDTGSRVFRVFGFKPRYGLCIFDYTRARFYTGKPSWVRVRLFGLTVFERNHHLSGLPGARRG